MHPRTPLAFLAQGHCWHRDSLLSTRTSRSLSAELLSASQTAAGAWGYSSPGTAPCFFRPIHSLFSLLITCNHLHPCHKTGNSWNWTEPPFSPLLGNLQQQINSITEEQPSSKATLLSSRKNVIVRCAAVTNAWQPGFYALSISPLTQAFMSGKLQSCFTVIHKWLVKACFSWSSHVELFNSFVSPL